MYPPSSSSDNPHHLLEQALTASRSGDAESAVRQFAEAAAAAPAWGLPRFLLGSELAAQHRWAAAEEHMSAAVLLSPQLHVARYQLGLLQFSSGRAAQAMLTWEPLLSQPDAANFHDFVRGFAALAGDDFEGARRQFSEGLNRPGLEPALASDIHKVLQAIDSKVAPAAQAGSTNETPSESEGKSAADSHVLLANYGKLTIH